MSFENPLEDILKTSLPYKLRQSADTENVNAMTEGRNITNKFVPLDKAIKAQNALAYGGKQGGIATFLRGISQLPVAERQIYLADPENRKNYMNMLEQYRQGNNSSSGGNILTPELLSQFGIGGGQPEKNQPNSMLDMITGGRDQGGSNPMQQSPTMGNEPQGLGVGSPQQGSPSQNVEQDVPVSPNVRPDQRQLYSAQLLANNHMVGSQLKSRADSAIAFDKTLNLLRPKIQKVITDAVKFNGIYGKGKGWLDKFKKDQPEEYSNFISARDSLLPLLGNGVRFVENMGQSAEAQKEANNLITSLQQIDVSPGTALKVFNNSMSYLDDVTQGVLDSAEPLHQGVRRKLAGVPHRNGDYIKIPSDNYGIVDSDGNVVAHGNDGQTSKFLKDHKGYSRRKM